MFKRAIPAAFLFCMAGCGPGPVSIDEVVLIEDTRVENAPLLIRAISAGEPALRQRALLAAARIQSEDYLEPLLSAARDDSAEIRRGALFALGQLGLRQSSTVPPAAREAVRELLDDADPLVRADAVEAFGKLCEPGVADELIARLQDEAARVRGAAAMALFRCRFTPVWRGESWTPPELPTAATTSLIGALSDTDPDVRYEAVYAFSRYGEPRAVERLAALATDDDWRVRTFALRGLGHSQDAEGARAALLAALDDPRVEVRIEAVQALAALGLSDLLPDSCPGDELPSVRAACAAAWSSADGERSMRALRRLLLDPVLAVRIAALTATAKRGGAEVDRLLDAAAGDESWQMRAAAAKAGFASRDPRQRWEQAFEDADMRVRAAALEGVGGLAAMSEMGLRALRERDLAVRGVAVSNFSSAEFPGPPTPALVSALVAAYRDSPGVEWIEVREGIADALAKVEDPAILQQMLGDSADSVRRKVAAALRARGIDVTLPPHAVDPSPYLAAGFDEDPLVVLHTVRGQIVIRCFAQEAPVHVAAFADLVERGFYDGLTWHRVVANFVVQGGDPRGDGWGGAGFTLRDEIGRRRFERGSVGMPKAGKDTGGGQLFITHVPTPHLDGNYTIFGQVIEGMELIDTIEIGDEILRAERG